MIAKLSNCNKIKTFYHLVMDGIFNEVKNATQLPGVIVRLILSYDIYVSALAEAMILGLFNCYPKIGKTRNF